MDIRVQVVASRLSGRMSGYRAWAGGFRDTGVHGPKALNPLAVAP